MRRHARAAMLILVVAAGCSKAVWRDALETEEVQALRAKHPAPIQFKAVVGLRLDAENFWRVGADEVVSLRDALAELAVRGEAASTNLQDAADRGSMSPAALRAKIERAHADVQDLRAKLAASAQGERAAAEKGLAELGKVLDKFASVKAKAGDARADDAARESLMLVLPDAAADYQTALGNLAPFEAALGDALKKAEENFNLLPPAMEDIGNQDWDAVDGKLLDLCSGLEDLKGALAPLAADKEDLAGRFASFVRANDDLTAKAAETDRETGRAFRAAWDLVRAASTLVRLGKRTEAASTLQEADGGLKEAVEAAARAETRGGATFTTIAQEPNDVAKSIQILSRKLAAAVQDGIFDGETAQTAGEASIKLDEAARGLDGACFVLADGRVVEACTGWKSAMALLAAAKDLLAAEADRLAEEDVKVVSVDPDPVAFRDGLAGALKGFGMFHGVEALATLPATAAPQEFLAEAARTNADLLVLMEPRRNDLAHMGFNANWYANLLIWSFAWFASNCVPDETWESRLALDVTVYDVRAREILFTQKIDSKAALNLSDLADGYHFLGIVTGKVTREDFEKAYPLLLTYHLNRVKAQLLEKLAVDFRAASETQAFRDTRNTAAPAGHAVVVGIGQYAPDALPSTSEAAKSRVAEMIRSALEGADVLDRVAAALKRQHEAPGASGAIQGVDALRKGSRLLEMAATELDANDLPVAARSLRAATDALAEAREALAIAEPEPAGAAKALETLDAVLGTLNGTLASVESLSAPPDLAELGKRTAILVPEAEPVPANLVTTADLIGEEGQGLRDFAPKMEEVVQALRDAENAFMGNDLPTALKAVRAVAGALDEALAAVQPLKEKAIEAAAVSGKIEFLKSEVAKILDAAGAFQTPEDVKSLGAACTAARTAVEDLVAALEAEEKKAEDRGTERTGAAEAAAPAAKALRALAAKLGDAESALTDGLDARAAEALGTAALEAAKIQLALKPLLDDAPTFIGEVLKALQTLEALVAEQDAQVRKAEALSPAGADLADLPENQRKVAQEVAKFAVEMDNVAANALVEGDEAGAAAVREGAETLRRIAVMLENAAQSFELGDAPGAQAREEEAVTALETAVPVLKEAAVKVPAAGKHAFATEGVLARQKALLQQTRNVIASLTKPLEPLAAGQEAVVRHGAEVVALLQKIRADFPKAEGEEPGLVAALVRTAEDLQSALERALEGPVMFRAGDTLGAGREGANLLDRLQASRASLAAATEGKRSHTDWIRDVAASAEAVRVAAGPLADILTKSARRYDVDRAAQDAQDFASFLGDPRGGGFEAFRVKTLLDGEATAEGIRAAFDGLLRNRVLADDLFVFYFAGCGALCRTAGGREGDFTRCLMPHDGDAADPLASALSLEELGDLLAGLEANNVLVVLDASFAPGTPRRGLGVLGGGEPKNLDDGFVRTLLKGPGYTVVTAGQAGEGATQSGRRGGLLTATLIKGARKDADGNGDGKITLAEMKAYLEREVAAQSAAEDTTQTPLVRGEKLDRLAFVPEK